MSYDVRLVDESGNTLPSNERFEEGGTYAVGGIEECDLNITYNYAQVFGGLVRELHGKTAADTLPSLQEFCARWAHVAPYSKDYWAPTPGNARVAIERLRKFAEQHPSGKWEVT